MNDVRSRFETRRTRALSKLADDAPRLGATLRMLVCVAVAVAVAALSASVLPKGWPIWPVGGVLAFVAGWFAMAVGFADEQPNGRADVRRQRLLVFGSAGLVSLVVGGLFAASGLRARESGVDSSVPAVAEPGMIGAPTIGAVDTAFVPLDAYTALVDGTSAVAAEGDDVLFPSWVATSAATVVWTVVPADSYFDRVDVMVVMSSGGVEVSYPAHVEFDAGVWLFVVDSPASEVPVESAPETTDVFGGSQDTLAPAPVTTVYDPLAPPVSTSG